MLRLGVRLSAVSSSSQETVLIWKFLTKTLISGELYKDRVNVSGNAGISDASITIDQLTMEDNGTYECSVSLMEDLGGTPKSRVQLLVLGECLHFFPGPAGLWCREGCREEELPGGQVKPDSPRAGGCSSLFILSCVHQGQFPGQRRRPVWSGPGVCLGNSVPALSGALPHAPSSLPFQEELIREKEREIADPR